MAKHKISKLTLALTGCMLTGTIMAATPFNNTGFSVNPSITNTTLRSDSQTSINWIVTNNTSLTLSGIGIISDYHSNGQAADFHTQNNSCQSLAPGASCSFNLSISGNQQPNQFQVNPMICGEVNDNGGYTLCSSAALQNPVQVNVNQINHPAFAYITTVSNTLTPINTQTLSPGNPLTGSFNFGGFGNNGVAVSPDGNTLYFADKGNKMLRVASGGDSPTLLASLNLGNVASDNLTSVVVSPNGQFVYLANSDVDNPRVYVVNVQNPKDPILMNTIQGIVSPTAMGISPDGSTIYIVGESNGAAKKIFVINASNNQIIATIPLAFQGVIGVGNSLAVSPDGTQVYISANDENNNGMLAVLNTSNHSVRYISFNNLSTAEAIAISPDGSTVYVGGIYQLGAAAISEINTMTGTVTRIEPQQSGAPLIGGIGASAITPDGSNLYFSNGYTAEIYALPIGQDQTTVRAIQLTLPVEAQTGNFIG